MSDKKHVVTVSELTDDERKQEGYPLLERLSWELKNEFLTPGWSGKYADKDSDEYKLRYELEGFLHHLDTYLRQLRDDCDDVEVIVGEIKWVEEQFELWADSHSVCIKYLGQADVDDHENRYVIPRDTTYDDYDEPPAIYYYDDVLSAKNNPFPEDGSAPFA